MVKSMKKIKLILMFIFLMFSYYLNIVDVNSQGILEEKIYCNATLDDDFVYNRILVILTRVASEDSKIYTISDFSDFGCVNIENITYYTRCIKA